MLVVGDASMQVLRLAMNSAVLFLPFSTTARLPSKVLPLLLLDLGDEAQGAWSNLGDLMVAHLGVKES